jgi:hypothetical protein
MTDSPHRVKLLSVTRDGAEKYYCTKCGAQFDGKSQADSHEANAGWDNA